MSESPGLYGSVILEFVQRQVEERADIQQHKDLALGVLFHDLPNLPGVASPAGEEADGQTRLCHLIERLYGARERLGEELFAAANQRIRRTLRQMLDQELKIAKVD